MSFKKALPIKKAVAFAGAASMLFGVSSLSAYEQDWNDKKLGDAGANSWFKVDGEVWASYEFKDKRPDGKVDYTGFTLGRATVNMQGNSSKDGDGWGYRFLMDSNTSSGNAGWTGKATPPTSTYFDGNTPMTPYVKYAYFQLPLMKGTFVRAGFQEMPTVAGSAGTSLEAIWDHRYLDGDGKAMWEELGLNKSSDAGLGLIHKNDMFGVHLLLANGEGYNQVFGANGQGTHLGLYQAGGLTAKDVAQGNKPSMGMDLYGLVSLTPLKSEKDSGLDLTIALPFRFQNIVGVESREYSGLSGLNANGTNPGNWNWTYTSGDARAKKDYSYGLEVDAKFKMNSESAITAGLGTAIKVDRQNDGMVINDSNVYNAATVNSWVTSGNYYQGRDQVGRAKYAFVHGKFGMFGFVARYSTGTGTNALSEQLGTATSNAGANDLIQGGPAVWNNLTSVANIMAVTDHGDSTFKKLTLALTFQPNARFRVALGMHDITATNNSGKDLKVDPMSNVSTVTPGDAMIAANTQLSALKTAKLITTADVAGVKNYDRQTFLRMVYYY